MKIRQKPNLPFFCLSQLFHQNDINYRTSCLYLRRYLVPFIFQMFQVFCSIIHIIMCHQMFQCLYMISHIMSHGADIPIQLFNFLDMLFHVTDLI